MPLIRKPPDAPAEAAPASLPATAGLRSASADERWEAARSLAGDHRAVAALGGALSIEFDPRVREAIFTSLAPTGSTASIDVVIPYLGSDEAEIRTSALDAMRAMPAATATRLPMLLANPDPDVRILACDLVRAVHADAATDLLSEVLDTDGEANVCAAAIDVLAERGTPAAIPSLRRCAERFSGEAFLQFAIDGAIHRIGKDRSAP